MGLSGCYGVMKYLMVLINLIFWLIGLAVVILAIWMLTDPTFYVSMAQDENNYYISLYIFLAAGALLLFVAFLGCCGAFKESKCMLISFFSFLLVILVAEIAAGVWAYSNANELELKIREAVKGTVQKEYGVVQSRTITFDAIQQNLKCCGVNGPSDWNDSVFNKRDKQALVLGITKFAQIYTIPKSCCSDGTSQKECETATQIGIGAAITGYIHSEGCTDKVVHVIKSNMNIVTGVAIGIIIIEVIGIIFSLVLCFAINRSDRYKA